MKRYFLTGLGALALGAVVMGVAAYPRPVLAGGTDSALKASLVDALADAQTMMLAQGPQDPSRTAASAPLANAPQTLTLDQAHAIALQNHPGIGAADYRVI